jgi:hypothetical protein
VVMLIYDSLSVPIRMYVSMPASCSRDGRDSLLSPWLAPGPDSGDHTRVGDKLAAKVACGYKLHPTYVLHGYDGLNLTAILICCMLACRRELAVRIPTNPVQTSSSITYSG